MSELRLYPNLPGVVASVDALTNTPVVEDNNSKFMVLGWHDSNLFDDDTPILFNEPYYCVNSTMAADMFGSTSELGKSIAMAMKGSEYSLT